jgi:hypothetical protein
MVVFFLGGWSTVPRISVWEEEWLKSLSNARDAARASCLQSRSSGRALKAPDRERCHNASGVYAEDFRGTGDISANIAKGEMKSGGSGDSSLKSTLATFR